MKIHGLERMAQLARQWHSELLIKPPKSHIKMGCNPLESQHKAFPTTKTKSLAWSLNIYRFYFKHKGTSEAKHDTNGQCKGGISKHIPFQSTMN